MSLVIQSIEDHKNDFNHLADLGIKWKTLDCKEHGTLFIFNYDQLTKHPKHPLVRECRNLVLHQDKKEKWHVISKSFRRFYNYGEHPEETKILVDAMLEDDLTVMAYEKLDGSLMVLSYHPLLKEWKAYTRGAFADQPFCGISSDEPDQKSFSDVFMECLHATHDDMFSKLNTNYSYVFELCSPGSHITNYDKQFIGLLTITDRTTETELPSHTVEEIAKQLDFVRPHSFEITSIEQLEKKLETMPPDFEGYVMVVEKHGIPQVRVKFKQDSYKALHHTCSGDIRNPRVHMPILLAGELEEVLTLGFAKKHEEFLRKKQAEVDKVFDLLEDVYNKYEHLPQGKRFALALQKEEHPLAQLLFRVHKGTLTLKECRQPWLAEESKKAQKSNKSKKGKDSTIRMTGDGIKKTHSEKVENAINWMRTLKNDYV